MVNEKIDCNYYCYSLRMAGFLMQRGFILFELRNDSNSNRKIYIFKKSIELDKAIDYYKNNK